MATTPSSWLDDAFKSAKEDFRRSLKNPALYDFSKIVQIDDVYDEARKIQSEQAKTKTLRGLKRLEPLINGLKEYSAVVEVFIQVKPDVMSLIWVWFILLSSRNGMSSWLTIVAWCMKGPLKLILQVRLHRKFWKINYMKPNQFSQLDIKFCPFRLREGSSGYTRHWHGTPELQSLC